jgi:hypothetical protein
MKNERENLLAYMDKHKVMKWDWPTIRSWEQSMKKIYCQPGDPDPLLALCELMADNIPGVWEKYDQAQFLRYMRNTDISIGLISNE